LPFFVPLVVGFLTGVGGLTAAAVGLTVGATAALAIGSTVLALGIYSYRKVRDLYDVGQVAAARPRSQTREYVARSTEAPRTLAYGQNLTVAGAMTFWNTAGDENRDMYIEIVLTGHEIDSFVGFYIGDRYVPIEDVADIVVIDLTGPAYRWTVSGSGSGEYFLEASGGGDPSVVEPLKVVANGVYMSAATAGALTAGQWDWADNDSLGFPTIYVRLSDSTDPDTKSDGYVQIEYGDGEVEDDTAGHQYDPPADTAATVLWLRAHRGIAGQSVDQQLNLAFTEITTSHRHRGCARLNVKMHLLDGYENIWDGGVMPDTIRTVISGAKVYDPRLDSTFSGAVFGSGSGAHRSNDPATWDPSDNPALIWADYRRNPLGPAWAASRIDYDSVAVAADHCDEGVDIPTATTERRFTCSFACSTVDDPGDVIEKILGSMFGQERDFNGQWHVYAGVWEAPTVSLGESDFIERTPYRKQPQFADRYNIVRGGYYDPERLYKFSPFIEVEDSNLIANRDASQELPKELRLECTSSEYAAQRLAFRHLNQADLTGLLIVRVGYKAANLRNGDRVLITHPTLAFDAKVFRLIKIQFLPLVGFELTLKEDAESAYDDPEEGDYGQRTAAGVVSFPRPVRARVPAGLVRDPSFSEAYGSSWYRIGGNNASIVTGETGNALFLAAITGTGDKRQIANRANFEISNREYLTVLSRIKRDGVFLGSGFVSVGADLFDATGAKVADAYVVIDFANYATLMPSNDTWYDLTFSFQIAETFTTTTQYARAAVSSGGIGTPVSDVVPHMYFDFVQIVRGQAA